MKKNKLKTWSTEHDDYKENSQPVQLTVHLTNKILWQDKRPNWQLFKSSLRPIMRQRPRGKVHPLLCSFHQLLIFLLSSYHFCYYQFPKPFARIKLFSTSTRFTFPDYCLLKIVCQHIYGRIRWDKEIDECALKV